MQQKICAQRSTIPLNAQPPNTDKKGSTNPFPNQRPNNLLPLQSRCLQLNNQPVITNLQIPINRHPNIRRRNRSHQRMRNLPALVVYCIRSKIRIIATRRAGIILPCSKNLFIRTLCPVAFHKLRRKTILCIRKNPHRIGPQHGIDPPLSIFGIILPRDQPPNTLHGGQGSSRRN